MSEDDEMMKLGVVEKGEKSEGGVAVKVTDDCSMEVSRSTILFESQPVETDESSIRVRGPDFETEFELNDLMNSYESIGFQASSLHQSIDIINRMRNWRLSDEDSRIERDSEDDERTRVFLGFTSNMISSGLREVMSYLTKHNHIDVIVTTAGGIEEDLIKCLAPTFLSSDKSFNPASGSELRQKGLNRIGNLIVPNSNYCKFEDWVIPILDRMRLEQLEGQVRWSPSRVIERLGSEINNQDSYLYWAAKNKIPVFCPALTDGSFGDMLCFHSIKMDPDPLVIDIVSDIRRINELGRSAKRAGMIVLGGGVCKHQIANSMLYRNGADYAVYVNTAQEFDGSDSGARPDEAVSWGKLKSKCESVKVFADATLVFPLIVASTWGKSKKKKYENENEMNNKMNN
ncbi:Deoxyhypusine synthase-domain-containing protein [Phakopsora pachyrhizi]|uniref:deoxyhypusine synthase n=1 Tax=Phakopsora pachyrhizi TaxID=170000 RepID=A0AAV0BPG8_PHAPC|nr:Deoxyhypusine synthase-domain-containing protein [Phakopsora pachyrhizi]